MANFSIELRRILETGERIFPDNYDHCEFSVPDKTSGFTRVISKEKFEEAFCKHFYFREIGAETVDQFKWFLADKINLVFPAYNEVLRASAIEYAVLDNYELRETTTRNIETEGESSGTATSEGTSTNTETATAKTTQEETSNAKTESENTATSEGSKTSNQSNTKKFLDTPQGLTNLNDSSYLTNLTDDKGNGSETVNNSQSESDTTETDSSRNYTENVTSSRQGSGEQTANNTTSTERKDTTKETVDVLHKGNIGVDSDAVMVQKHIKLQKMVANVYRDFFKECEDLFMLVF